MRRHVPAPARRILSLALAGSALLAGAIGWAEGATPPTPPAAPAPEPGLSAIARIGEKMFYDTRLSASGQLSCAVCHDPANHYAPANALAVQRGGPHMAQFGLRSVPTLTYKSRTPAFSFGPEDPSQELNEASPLAVAQQGAAAKGTGTIVPASRVAAPQKVAGNTTLAAPVPRGGLFWDGRADTLEEQAQGPLLAHFEMAEPSPAALAEALRRDYGKPLATLFGAQVLDDDAMLLSEADFALARYQIESPSFHPFDSKYDAYLAGKVELSPAEARGLKLFDDPEKGNCAACHLDRPGADGSPPLFTDFEYEALGVPRNPAIRADADPAFFDLGLCGPMRQDAVSQQPANCGLFKTPTLRNVATRKVFFHNGVYRSLAQVLDFYARRDADPAAIYPTTGGRPQAFDDLPARYRGNIDATDAPFGRKPAQGAALTAAEEADIVAFLGTLTDGYSSKAGKGTP